MKTKINHKKWLIFAVASLILYAALIFFLGKIKDFSIGVEFIVAIMFVFIYFSSAILVLSFSLNKSFLSFMKSYFSGAAIRILLAIIVFTVLLKFTTLDILKLLLYMAPIYFIYLIIEVLWLNDIAKHLEKN